MTTTQDNNLRTQEDGEEDEEYDDFDEEDEYYEIIDEEDEDYEESSQDEMSDDDDDILDEDEYEPPPRHVLQDAKTVLKTFHHQPETITRPNNLEGEIGRFKGTMDGEVTPLKCFELVFSAISDDLLEAINERRLERRRKREYKIGKRGRKTTNTDSYESNRKKYINRFEDPFSKTDFYSFLSCFLMIGVVELKTLGDYWNMPNTDEIGMGLFFRSRIPQYKFQEIYRCLSGDVTGMEGKLVVHFLNIWELGYVLSLDESMIKAMMRDNPHHIHMKLKPIKNGIKLYTVADTLTFLGYFCMHKRTNEEPEDEIMFQNKKKKFKRGTPAPKHPAIKAVTDALDIIGGKHIFIMDRYYSSPKTVVECVNRGQEMIGMCKSDRSSEFFKNGLHKKKPNKLNTVIGSIIVNPGHEENETLVHGATVTNKKKRKINLISSESFSNKYCSVKETEMNDSDESLAGMKVPEQFAHYHIGMGNVDQANKSIAETQYPHRNNRWRVAVIIWYLSVVVHNSWVLYNSLKPNSERLAKIEFVKLLSRQLCPSNINSEHKQEQMRDPQTGKAKSGKCVIHRYFGRGSCSCNYRCTICGPVCLNCFDNQHETYLFQKLQKTPPENRKRS